MGMTNGELLARIDERGQADHELLVKIDKRTEVDHDAILVLAGKHDADVEELKGKIRNTNIWQGLGTAIGTFLGTLFAFTDKS